ncbi:hypothetical protein CI109_101438 [Kwoniella shandongensis]|uniref:Uncharacterized protein n=1 Tax=Kwoniella shandongensis TaxID=1734106 RepID=A0A5M6BUN2_9TREE|nr:uncharacterized protein CI109_005133 [Kwoniella shandongensis]KAA5526557.1 hypothetical protein CI109_005133 [Kwoniella shandongensis]
MLARLRRKPAGPPPDPKSVNYSAEHVALAKTIARRQRMLNSVWRHVPLIRAILATVGVLWLLALPYEGLWKRTYVDEHALQPAQVTMYFDWANVHQADLYLDELEKIANSSIQERSTYLQNTFSASGLRTGSTPTSTYAHVTPPRSAGTESILLSANWLSRDGGPNLRGVAMLLAFGDFLRGQNHWAFDFILVVGEDYMSGLEGFMREYHSILPGVIWTGLNIDYPGHSFSHLGLFYEGVNGRLPNQDVVNTVAHVARHSGGVLPRYHDIKDEPEEISFLPFTPSWLSSYVLAAKHLLHHFAYTALGRATGAHGVLARHRIDSLTLYCTPATGPHGFHTLGRTLESTSRSFNNLLERLHASYFFYLLPRPDWFIPVGHYLPAAVLLGASLTIGGFDCPSPLGGLFHMLPSFIPAVIAALGIRISSIPMMDSILPMLIAIGLGSSLPVPKGDAKKSLESLTLLLYGALIPTLAMINFPQAILLASIALLYLTSPTWLRVPVLGMNPMVLVAMLHGKGVDIQQEWIEYGNFAWPGVLVVWLPLWVTAWRLIR